MRIFYQILIIFFVIGSIFILKDDIILIVNKFSSYIEKSSNKNEVFKFEEKKDLPIIKKIDAPGALRVAGDYLGINNTILSKDNIISLHNINRKENGDLVPLKENAKLNFSSDIKLKDMFAKQYFDHISPSGTGVADLGKEAGYDYIIIGENLAMGNFKDDKALVDAWMASPGHRANILNKNYTEIGIAVSKGKFEGKNIWMAVAHFGVPMSECPIVDSLLYGIININQSETKKMEEDLIARKDSIDKGLLYEGTTYFEQVTKYNELISNYNFSIKNIKEKIDKYNKQVLDFNNCLLSKQ
jgi:hypothetical protein